MQENLRSPHEYRANGTIAAMVQEFFAATIGGYRAFIKCSAQREAKPPSARTQVAGRLRQFKASISGDATDADAPLAADSASVGAGMPPRAQSAASLARQSGEEGVIAGDGGWRFYHAAFVDSFSSRTARAFAAALLHTQLWQVFVRGRMERMRRHEAPDEFEARVLARQDRARSLGGQVCDRHDAVCEQVALQGMALEGHC